MAGRAEGKLKIFVYELFISAAAALGNNFAQQNPFVIQRD